MAQGLNRTKVEQTGAGAYIRRIRNPAKQDYARRYLAYLVGYPQGPHAHEPERGQISYLAAQAVRFELSALLKS